MSKKDAIFLDGKDGVFTKEERGHTYTLEELGENTIKFKVNDDKSQFAEEIEGKYGPYYMVKLFGGTGFISFKSNKRGRYALLKLGDRVVIPSTNPQEEAEEEVSPKQKKPIPQKSKGYKRKW